ncbi:hypothetical protein P3T76_003241 [Phytophthora citrophthora]|uniref:G-patch domain-containing protein n=1 Tax=Phytophthora citrophthora TaxID=4793 RepID=A0AAD9LPA2_9STRA|nr:hypothetical protein P3T76_003241 [Phytophthora citrophthora]
MVRFKRVHLGRQLTFGCGNIWDAFGTDHALDASNRGYRLLVKMGWSSGSGLGKHEQGQG